MANKDEEFVDDFENNNFEYANEDEEEDNEEKVQVRFTTALPEEYKVPETPIFVPISSTRYALSKIVNHLLSLGIYFFIFNFYYEIFQNIFKNEFFFLFFFL